MLADFLGKGWRYPVGLDRDARIQMSRGEESIRDSIWIILATAPGERVMRADFGCGIHDLAFALNDADTRGRVKELVFQALIRWEPRIDVLDVDIEVKGHLDEQLLINIHYRVRSTNN